MSKPKGVMTPAEFKDKVEPPKEVAHLRARVSELEAKISSFREGQGELIEMIHSLGSAVDVAESFPTQYFPPSEPVSSPVNTVLQICDWHYGAVQGADEIERFGQFSPDIARRRIQDILVPAFVNWVDLHRRAYTCDVLRILVLGDLISGDIHDELLVTNAFPSPVQAVKVAYLFSDMVQSLAPHFGKVIIDFVTADNHGRMTRKPQAKEEGMNCFGYVIAYLVKERLRDHNNVEMNIHVKMQATVDVTGMKYLILHGHQIRGWAGIPFYGIERKVSKEAQKRLRAFAEIREAVRFDKVVMGHFHTPSNMEDWMIGGSLSGTDAYDHKNGRYSRATQTAWLVHPRHGEFDWTKFRLDA